MTILINILRILLGMFVMYLYINALAAASIVSPWLMYALLLVTIVLAVLYLANTRKART